MILRKHRLLDMPRQTFATLLWNFSEWSGMGLGRFAPIIFGWMIGVKGKKVEDK